MAFDIKIQVEAIDRASAVLQALRQSIGGLGVVSDRVSAAMKNIGSISGGQALNKFSEAAQEIPAKLNVLDSTLAGTTLEIGRLSTEGVGSGQAVAELGKHAAESSQVITNLAESLARIQNASGFGGAFGSIAGAAGTSVESLREFETVARQHGVTVGELSDGFAHLAWQIKLAGDPASEAARNFQALGIDIQQLGVSQQSVGAMLPLLADGLGRIESGAGRAHIALALLGQDGAKLTPVLTSIAGRASAGQFSNFEGALKMVGLSLKDVEQKSEESASTFSRVRDVIRQNTLVFGGLAAAIASVPAALGLLTRNAIAMGDGLNDIATSTGISVEFLSGLDLATRQNGTSLDELILGFKGLSRQMVDAQDPASEAAQIFRILGIDIRALTEDQKKLENFLPRLADGFTRLERGAGRIDIAQALLGRSGAQLLPLLEQGSDGIRRTVERARELGGVMSGTTARAADEFNDKLSELGVLLRGIGTQIAGVVLPYLSSFVDLVTSHSTVVKLGFLGMAGAVTTLGFAMTGLRIGTAIDALLTAIAGPAAIAKITSMTGLMLALREGFLGLLAPLGSVAAATNGALGLAVVARIGLVGLAVAGLAGYIWTATSAWRAYRAKQEEALATKNLERQNIDLRGRTETLIRQFKIEGKITEQQAAALQEELQKGFEPKTVQVPKVGLEGSLADKVFGRKPVLVNSSAEDQSRTLLKVQRELRKALGDDSVGGEEALRIAKTELEIAQAKLEVVKSTSSLELQTLQIEQEKQFSTVTAEEFARRRLEINQRVYTAEIEQINKREKLERSEVVRQATLKFAPIKDDAERQKAIASETAQAVELISTKANSDRAQLISQSVETELQIRSGQSTAELEIEKRTTQFRLEEAQSRHDELRASEIQFQLDLLEIGEKVKNLPVDRQALVQAELVGRARRKMEAQNAEINEKAAMRRLELQQTIFQSELALAQNDPTANAAAKQERINQLLRDQNAIIQTEIALNRDRLSKGGLSAEDELQRKRRLIELEAQQIANRRAANLQDPTNLPGFQGALGFQNSLDAQGNQIFNPDGTKARELIAPFRALDDFLSGTLQTTFNSLSQSLAGLVTGATTWAQVWTQAGNQIIGMIVELILEYTLFHQIRSALDSIFHRTAKVNIATTAAAGRTAQAEAGAQAVATSTAVGTAAVPAATGTTLWSFGSNATIGLALALAAIAAITAALAFSAGGVVPERPRIQAFASGGVTSGGIYRGPGGPTDDKILTTAPPGTGILTASAVQYFGGQSFVTKLLTKRLPLPWLAGQDVAPAPIPRSNWSPPGGVAVPIRVSAGEAEIPPETVAFYGGPRFIDLLNSKRLPLDIINGRALHAVAAKNLSFAVGGVVGALGHITAPAFAEGGVLGAIDVSHISVQSFADGGAVSVDPSSAQAARVSNLLQAHFESNPNVTVDPQFNFFAVRNERELIERLRSLPEARSWIIDVMTGAKSEIGIRS